MRKVLLAGLFVTFGVFGVTRVQASEGFDDLAKMAKSGVNDDVLLAYIDASNVAYDLTVDEILYFNDLGVSPKVVSSIVKHGKELREAGLNAAPQRPLDPPPSPTPAIAAPPQQQDAPQNPVIGGPDFGDVENQGPQPIQAAPTTEIYSEAPVAPAPGDANISTFYDALTPYGNWVNVEGEYVWQPNAVSVDPNWRPYVHRGHWVATDAGWAWQSDYSWGWAPFHYGRWARHDRYGWIWHPDTVWGPAWVSWRNNDIHAGWAPLPPAAKFEAGVGFHFGGRHTGLDVSFGLVERDYTFVPVEHFCEPTVITYTVPRERVTVVYEQTTIVQNTYVVEHDRVINRGIDIELVARASHREIKPVAVVDVNIQVGGAIRGTAVTGSSFAVYRPQIKNEAPINPEVIAARRAEEAKRVAIRQQARTEKTQIRQDNSVDRTAARQQSETERTQARQEAAAKAAQARSEARANEVTARQQAAERKVEARSDASANAAETRADNKEQRAAEVAAREQARREAETKAQADRQSAAETKRQQAQDAAASRQADTLAREQARRDAEAKAQADRQQKVETRKETANDGAAARQADLQAREQARRDAEAKAQADRQQKVETRKETANDGAAARQADVQAREQAKRDAEAARQADVQAREQARRDAEAKAQADRQQKVESRKETANDGAAARQADVQAREQAKRDAEAARQADAQARAQARRDAEAKAAAEAQARKDARAAAAAAKRGDPTPDDGDPNTPDTPKKKKKRGDDN